METAIVSFSVGFVVVWFIRRARSRSKKRKDNHLALNTLGYMYAKGLITEPEYEAKRMELTERIIRDA